MADEKRGKGGSSEKYGVPVCGGHESSSLGEARLAEMKSDAEIDDRAISPVDLFTLGGWNELGEDHQLN